VRGSYYTQNDYLFGGMCSGRSVAGESRASQEGPFVVVAIIKTGRKFDITLLLSLLLLLLLLL
jgi:hypothetical protein